MGRRSNIVKSTTISVSEENHAWLASLIEYKGESFDDILTRLRTGNVHISSK